jgi:hypothetical protein
MTKIIYLSDLLPASRSNSAASMRAEGRIRGALADSGGKAECPARLSGAALMKRKLAALFGADVERAQTCANRSVARMPEDLDLAAAAVFFAMSALSLFAAA